MRFIPTVLAFGSICFGAAAFGAPTEAPATKLTVSIQSPEPGSESGPAAPTANPETASRVSDGAENLSQKLQELLSSPRSNLIDLPVEKTAVKAFYQARGFKPFWTANGEPTAKAKAKDVSEFLRTVGTQGLDPADYPTPDFSLKLNAEESAVNEVRLTHSFLTYARHASSGRVSFTRVSGVILYPSHAPDPAQLLAQLDSTGNVRELLASLEPPHAGYKALKGELAKELSGSGSSAETTGTAVSDSADVAPKKSKKRTAKAAPAPEPKIRRTDVLIANMERWRWLPRDLGAAYVMVNIPDYTLKVANNDNVVWGTKIVVGKPGDLATPLLSETMKFLTINPTWNVPPSIIRNEYLPSLQRNPAALERMGLKVGRNKDGSLRVYQPPGARNALGRIRFNFPNPFLVYQHDTPSKLLFAQDRRALSHGCMRVENPEKYAEVLLSISQPKDKVTAERIRSYYGDDERTISLKQPIPVHVTYQTAFFDDAGRFKTRDDIYGLDATLLKVMRGDERLIADKPIARDYQTSSKPVPARIPVGSGGERRADTGRDVRPRYEQVYGVNPYYSGPGAQ